MKTIHDGYDDYLILLDAPENLCVKEDEEDNWNYAGKYEAAPVLVVPEYSERMSLQLFIFFTT